MGLARFFEEGAATFDRVVGTFAYLAPERYRGETFTAKSDIYSMAIVFWECKNSKKKIFFSRYLIICLFQISGF